MERVGSMSIIDNYLITGSWDKRIIFYDLWEQKKPCKIYKHHN